MPRFCRLSVTGALLFLLALLAVPPLTGKALAVPVTTKYYSVELPPDWVVVNGPAKVKEAVQVVVGQKDHKSSALIIVGPAGSGEAEQAAVGNARRLDGTKPVLRANGQWEFTFAQNGVKGYCVVREDAPSGLLLMLIVSGDFKLADFVYQMRGPYKALMPLPPVLP